MPHALAIGAAVTALIAASAQPGIAQQQSGPTETPSILHELSGEMFECVSYFYIVAQCVENTPNEPGSAKLASDYRANADRLNDLAVKVAQSAGETAASILAYMKLVTETQKSSVNGSCINVSVLLERYSAFCKHMAQSPDNRLNELTAGKTCTAEYQCR
jgi:hypothetical protein